jgi:hypothetical protein
MNTQGRAIAAIGLIGVVSWENECRKRGINFRPSVGLNKAAFLIQKGWSKLGTFAAHVGNRVLGNLDELATTSVALLKPVFDMVTSPVYFYWSYVNTVSQFRYPILAVVGTTSAGLVAFTLTKNRTSVLEYATRMYRR